MRIFLVLFLLVSCATPEGHFNDDPIQDFPEVEVIKGYYKGKFGRLEGYVVETVGSTGRHEQVKPRCKVVIEVDHGFHISPNFPCEHLKLRGGRHIRRYK